jgi:hypothetical protein
MRSCLRNLPVSTSPVLENLFEIDPASFRGLAEFDSTDEPLRVESTLPAEFCFLDRPEFESSYAPPSSDKVVATSLGLSGSTR